MMSAVVGASLCIILMVLRGRDHQVQMPFGPFLAGAGWITMLWGDDLNALFNLPF